MARIRSIKPEFFTSETIAKLDVSARLTFIGLWTYVDDNGVGLDNARLVNAAIWPLEEDPTAILARTRADLASLQEHGLIERYSEEGRQFLYIRSWADHQKVSHPRKARYPLPSEVAPENVPSTLESVRPEQGSGSREQGIEQGSGSREQGTREAPPLPATAPEDEFRTWMGESSGALNTFAAMEKAAGLKHDPLWEMSLWGMYRPQFYGGPNDDGGTHKRDMGKEPVDQWPEIIGQALMEASSKKLAFAAGTISSFVVGKVLKRERERKRAQSVPFMTKGQEDAREAERRANIRPSDGPSIIDIGAALANAGAQTARINQDDRAREEWYEDLEPHEQALIEYEAREAAVRDLPASMAKKGIPPGVLGAMLKGQIEKAWKASQEQGAA